MTISANTIVYARSASVEIRNRPTRFSLRSTVVMRSPVPLPSGEGGAKRRVRGLLSRVTSFVAPHPALRATFSRWEKDRRALPRRARHYCLRRCLFTRELSRQLPFLQHDDAIRHAANLRRR